MGKEQGLFPKITLLIVRPDNIDPELEKAYSIIEELFEEQSLSLTDMINILFKHHIDYRIRVAMCEISNGKERHIRIFSSSKLTVSSDVITSSKPIIGDDTVTLLDSFINCITTETKEKNND